MGRRVSAVLGGERSPPGRPETSSDRPGPSVSGLDFRTGRILWEKKKIGQAPVILHDKTFISGDVADHGGHATVHDLLTGEKIGDFPFRVNGCNYIIGSKHLDHGPQRHRGLCRHQSEEELQPAEHPLCAGSNSLPAADGLLNAPNYAFGCICNYPIQTSFAMGSYMPEVTTWSGTEPLTVPPPGPSP